jgi:heme exporter protein A
VPARYFSTGQKKRAALARLIASAAPLWLLDEPANGLDRDGVALIEALIAAHRAAGGAVVCASHLPLTLGEAQTIDMAAHRAGEVAA